MRIIHLNLKDSHEEPWFSMVRSGVKKEEYREIKPYWIDRLQPIIDGVKPCPNVIIFSNGYAKNRPSFMIECKGLRIGSGKSEWGARPGIDYYVFKLGGITRIS
jgi:hypothetical protein